MFKLTRCGCSPYGLVRVRRAAWMRLFPARGLYFCPICGTKQLLNRRALTLALVGNDWSAQVPAARVPPATDETRAGQPTLPLPPRYS